MILINLALFAVLGSVFGGGLVALGSYWFGPKHLRERERYALWFAPLGTLLFSGYLAGAWYLWDTADIWADLAVVRNGKVVELGRTFVLTNDGTRTFVLNRLLNPGARSARLFELTVPGKLEDPSRVFAVVRRSPDLSDLERAQMDYDLRKKFGNAGGEDSVRLAVVAIFKEAATDAEATARLREELAQFGWFLEGVIVSRIPNKAPN